MGSLSDDEKAPPRDIWMNDAELKKWRDSRANKSRIKDFPDA